MLRATYSQHLYATKDEVGGGTKNLYYVEYSCLSTDTKPTEGIVTGSICIEVDTGDLYMFDEDGVQWVKQASLQE